MFYNKPQIHSYIQLTCKKLVAHQTMRSKYNYNILPCLPSFFSLQLINHNVLSSSFA
jgi:hypothetical protein